jgi:hypothetical protein
MTYTAWHNAERTMDNGHALLVALFGRVWAVASGCTATVLGRLLVAAMPD